MTRTFVTIDRLEIYARHGIMEQESVAGNLFEVSVKVEYDFIAAAEDDDINKALDYAELTELVVEEMKRPRKLLESVATGIQKRITARWPEVKGGVVTIVKIHPPIPAPTPRASVTVEW